MDTNKLAGAIAAEAQPEAAALEIDPAIVKAIEDINRRIDAMPESKKRPALGLAAATFLQRVAEEDPQFAAGMHIQGLVNLGINIDLAEVKGE